MTNSHAQLCEASLLKINKEKTPSVRRWRLKIVKLSVVWKFFITDALTASNNINDNTAKSRYHKMQSVTN